MIFTQVITYWLEDNDGNKEPYFANTVTGDSWVDVTRNVSPPQPNSVVIECIVNDVTFAQIESDSDLYILWDMPNPKPPGGTPDTAEWALLNAFLSQQGYTPQERRDAIGLTPNGRSRLEVGNDLIGWLRER